MEGGKLKMKRYAVFIFMVVALFLGMGIEAMAQTNTIGSIYADVTGDYVSTFDGLTAIAIAVLVVSVGFALIKSMVPHRLRVK